MNFTNNYNTNPIIIGIDHGYGNIKTAHCCFKAGVAAYDKEPTFKGNLLVYEGRYYLIGEEHKEFISDKMADSDYYILTLAAVARELNIRKLTSARVHLAAGLPLTWVSEQKHGYCARYLLGKQFIALCGSANIIVDDNTVFVIAAEVFENAASAAHHIQTHQFGIVFMLTQSAEDTLRIFGCGITDGGQITLADVCRAVTNKTLKDGFIHRHAKLLHQIFSHSKHTLVGSILFGKALFRKRAALVDIHEVHCAVANIAEHIDTLELTELVCNRRKALWENICSDKINMIVNTLKSEVGAVVLQKIRLEAVDRRTD